MKIQTNVRAGGQNRRQGSSTDSTSSSSDVYVPPVSRCAGI